MIRAPAPADERSGGRVTGALTPSEVDGPPEHTRRVDAVRGAAEARAAVDQPARQHPVRENLAASGRNPRRLAPLQAACLDAAWFAS
jgi:hypothetical protein